MFKPYAQQIQEMMKGLPQDENYMSIDTYRKHYERMISVQSDPEKIKEMEETYTKNMNLMLTAAIKQAKKRTAF